MLATFSTLATISHAFQPALSRACLPVSGKIRTTTILYSDNMRTLIQNQTCQRLPEKFSKPTISLAKTKFLNDTISIQYSTSKPHRSMPILDIVNVCRLNDSPEKQYPDGFRFNVEHEIQELRPTQAHRAEKDLCTFSKSIPFATMKNAIANILRKEEYPGARPPRSLMRFGIAQKLSKSMNPTQTMLWAMNNDESPTCAQIKLKGMPRKSEKIAEILDHMQHYVHMVTETTHHFRSLRARDIEEHLRDSSIWNTAPEDECHPEEIVAFKMSSSDPIPPYWQ